MKIATVQDCRTGLSWTHRFFMEAFLKKEATDTCCMIKLPRFHPNWPFSYERIAAAEETRCNGWHSGVMFLQTVYCCCSRESERVIFVPVELEETRQKVTPEICPWTSFAHAQRTTDCGQHELVKNTEWTKQIDHQYFRMSGWRKTCDKKSVYSCAW